jgi:hypothetical protein
VKAPKEALAPSVSASVAGTVRRAVLVTEPERAVARVDGDRLRVDAVRVRADQGDAVGGIGDLVARGGLLVGAGVRGEAGRRGLCRGLVDRGREARRQQPIRDRPVNGLTSS